MLHDTLIIFILYILSFILLILFDITLNNILISIFLFSIKLIKNIIYTIIIEFIFYYFLLSFWYYLILKAVFAVLLLCYFLPEFNNLITNSILFYFVLV